jgi:hypothetical protein
MKYTRRRQLLHALKFHMLDKATDRVKGPGMTGFTPEQKHQMRMNKAGHNVPIHAGRSRRRKTRGGVETNPIDAPSGYGASGTAALAKLAAQNERQQALASTATVGGPLPTIGENGDNAASTATVRSNDVSRGSVRGLFDKKGGRHTRRRGARASRKRPTR